MLVEYVTLFYMGLLNILIYFFEIQLSFVCRSNWYRFGGWNLIWYFKRGIQTNSFSKEQEKINGKINSRNNLDNIPFSILNAINYNRYSYTQEIHFIQSISTSININFKFIKKIYQSLSIIFSINLIQKTCTRIQNDSTYFGFEANMIHYSHETGISYCIYSE